jgi:4'-phosphopantetheinyl transferase EntD
LRALAAAAPSTYWDRLLFSAKESVYKAWFPLTDEWLDFHDATISFDRAGTFCALILVAGPGVGGRRLTELQGRWLQRAGLAMTAIAVPAAP